MKKIIAAMFMFLFVATVLPCALAEGTNGSAVNTGQAGFESIKDVSADYWGRNALSALFGDGIMTGYDGYIRPEANITRGEFCAVINRTFGFSKIENAKQFSDISYANNTWKTKAVEIASSQGYLKGTNGKALADQCITREQAFTILSRVLKQDAVTGKTTFSDDDQISSWAREQVNAMWKAGYVAGYENRINALGNISRAETAQALYNVMGVRISTAGTYDYSGAEIKNMTVTCDGAYIKNANIKGNLYVTEGVGTGTATFENCTVSGTSVISGGGTHSVVWINTKSGSVKIEVPDGTPVRLVLSGSSQTGDMTVQSNATVDTSKNSGAGVQGLAIDVPEGSSVTLVGKFDSVEANSSVGLTLDAGTVIDKLTVNSPITVLGTGTVNKANVNADNVKFQVMPTSITLGNDVSVPPTQTGSPNSGVDGGTSSTYKVEGVTLYGSFPDASAVYTDGKWVFDLTNTTTYKDTDTISKIKILTDGNSSFKIQDVGEVPTNQDVTISDALSILKMNGPSAVSLQALRMFGSLSISGTINGTSVTIVFNLSSSLNAYYNYSLNGTTITATRLKDAKIADFVSSFGKDPVAAALLKYTPQDGSGPYVVTAVKGGINVSRTYSDYNDMTNGLQSDGIVQRLNASSLQIDDLSDLTGYSVTVQCNGTLLARVVFAG